MFLAVQPPADIIEDLEDHVDRRPARDDRRVRWTASRQWHITLAFMPAVDEDVVEGFADDLRRRFAQVPPVTLQLAGGGQFGPPGAARVLFARVGPDPSVTALHSWSERSRLAARRASITVGGEFTPHLTVARMSRPLAAERWLRWLDTYTGPAWTCAAIELIESRLGAGPGGSAVHRTVAHIPLSAASSPPMSPPSSPP